MRRPWRVLRNEDTTNQAGNMGSTERGGSIIGRIAQGSLITAGHITVTMGTTLTATTPSRRIPLRSAIVHHHRQATEDPIVHLTTGHLTTDRLLTGLMTVLPAMALLIMNRRITALLATMSLLSTGLLIVHPRITALQVTMSPLLINLPTTDPQVKMDLLLAGLLTTDLQVTTAPLVDHHHPTTKTTVSHHHHHHITTTDLLVTTCLTP
jgi:hypothetical protein